MYFQKTQTLQQADALEITPQHVQELGNKSGARLLPLKLYTEFPHILHIAF